MRRTIFVIAGVALLAAPALVRAQTDTTRSGVLTQLESIFGALGLPQAVEEARQEGVPDGSIVTVIEEIRRSGASAADAEDILAQEVEAVRAGGPVGNFGAFVQSQLAAGLRGRALAEAIRAEHRRNGIGIPADRPQRDRAQIGRGRGNVGGGAARGAGAEPGGPDTARGRAGGQGRGRSGGTP